MIELFDEMAIVKRIVLTISDPHLEIKTGNERGGYGAFARGENLDTASRRARVAQRLSEDRGILDRKSTRLNSSHVSESRMPSSA